MTDPTEAEAGSRVGHRLFSAWEALPFPTVAAIRGICLGGGLEISLASTYRVASDRPDTKMGLPEVRLGILPGWGGSTRLPRRIGIAEALDLILTGKTVVGRKALKLGLIDALLPDARFLDDVCATSPWSGSTSRRRDEGEFDLKEMLLEKNPFGPEDPLRPGAQEDPGDHTRALPGAAARHRGGAGGDRGRPPRRFRRRGPRRGRARHLADVEESDPRLPADRGGQEGDRACPEPRRGRSTRPPCSAPGVMGGGIAQLIAAETSLPVRMKDVRDEALASGMQHAARLFAKQVERRRLTAPESRRKMALLHPTLDYSGFRPVDLVIEAIVENMGVKQEVFAETAKHVRRGRHARLQHLVAVGRRHRLQDPASGAGGRHALLQSGRTRCRWWR